MPFVFPTLIFIYFDIELFTGPFQFLHNFALYHQQDL